MRLFAIIPVKPFREGKSRLRNILSDTVRCDFNRQMFEHVLAIATSVLSADRIAVVSADLTALDLARDRGALVVQEQTRAGLNPALKDGADTATARGADAVLILPTDLPTISQGDIEALMDHATPCRSVVIAPDRLNQGTNALLLCPPDTIEFSFGPNSYTNHREAARALQLNPVTVQRNGLAFDIDTPEDYRQLERQGWCGGHPVTSN